MIDGYDIFSTILVCALLVGAYAWGRNKGYEKSNFENDLQNQNNEIKSLRAELEAIKIQKAIEVKDE